MSHVPKSRPKRPLLLAMSGMVAAVLTLALASISAPAAIADDLRVQVTVTNLAVDTTTPESATVTFDYVPDESVSAYPRGFRAGIYVTPAGLNWYQTDDGDRDYLYVSAPGSYTHTFALPPGDYTVWVGTNTILDCIDCGGAEPDVFTTADFTVTAKDVEPVLPTLQLISTCDYTVTFAIEGGDPATYTNLAAEAYSDSPDVNAGKFVTAGTTDSITTPEYPSAWTFYVSAVNLQGEVVSTPDSFTTTLPGPPCENPTPTPTPEPTATVKPEDGGTSAPPTETATPSPTTSPSPTAAASATLAATGPQDVSATTVAIGALLLAIGGVLMCRRPKVAR